VVVVEHIVVEIVRVVEVGVVDALEVVSDHEPLRPRDPLRGEQRPVAGQQLGLQNGRCRIGELRHADRPVPAGVAPHGGGEQQGVDALALVGL
jgi:hypothetical protein